MRRNINQYIAAAARPDAQTMHRFAVLTALIAAAMLVCAKSGWAETKGSASPPIATPKGTTMNNGKAEEQNHPYVGMWVTEDGYIRHELLPIGRYDEARGKVKSAYRGRYRVSGNHIDYVDDTGFTADGDFRAVSHW